MGVREQFQILYRHHTRHKPCSKALKVTTVFKLGSHPPESSWKSITNQNWNIIWICKYPNCLLHFDIFYYRSNSLSRKFSRYKADAIFSQVCPNRTKGVNTKFSNNWRMRIRSKQRCAKNSKSWLVVQKAKMDSPSLPMDVRDINVCLLSAKKKKTSSPSLRTLDQMSLWWVCKHQHDQAG